MKSSQPGEHYLQSELILREYDQAWQHYRHLENDRSITLGFFFTVTLTAAGWLGKIGVDHERLLMSLFVVFVVGGLSLLVAIRVARINILCLHYDSVIKFIRKKAYGKDFGHYNLSLNAHSSRPVLSSKFSAIVMSSPPWFEVSCAATYLVSAGLGIWNFASLGQLERFLALILSLALLAFALTCAVRLNAASKQAEKAVTPP